MRALELRRGSRGVPSRPPGEFAPSSADDVRDGLRRDPKRLPSRMLHEGIGAELFDELTGIDDYYPSRCELRLLDAHLPAIVAEVGRGAHVLEVGGDTGIRGKRLRRALDETTAPRRLHGATLVFIPGTIIDTLEPRDAVQLLGDLQRTVGQPARLLVGADGSHDQIALQRAYDDEQGVTAAFAKHVLVRLNRQHEATFDLDAFEHRAVWNAQHARVELHLVSLIGQEVSVGGERFAFAASEPLVTEHAYKHSLHAMRSMLFAAGWSPTQVFTANEQPVRLWLCEPRAST
jgi:uncharacterized SAM-dependent methyltransferase